MNRFPKNLAFALTIGVIALVLGFISVFSQQMPAVSQKTGPSVSMKTADETQYLVFVPKTDGIYETSDAQTFDLINARVSEIIDLVGTVGDKSHKLAYGIFIPPWMIDAAFPGRIPVVIREAFNVAKKRNIAVHFTVESHYLWETRPDLWNYFDRNNFGYNPDNKNNVEWMDWKGTPHPHRYFDWGSPIKLAPHMCYNCPKVKAEISRLVSKVIGPAIKAGIDDLKQVDKEYLFAGVTVGSEPSLDDYSNIDTVHPAIGRLMDKDKTPKVRLGYNALSNAGYSEKNPPKDFSQALAKVNQEFIAFWAKQLMEAGIPSSRLYTHIAAGAGGAGSPMGQFMNAPLWVAFNDYSRPGWTTYPDEPLKKDFSVLYKELEKHGSPHWGGTESSPHGPGGTKVPIDEYLSRHFYYGATLVVMNTGATSDKMTKRLLEGVWSKEARRYYKTFLDGK